MPVKSTTTFIDNMGTGMMVAIEVSKSMELKGDMVNPVNGKKTLYKEVFILLFMPKTRKMEMFDVKNEKEFKSMEIIMKKR